MHNIREGSDRTLKAYALEGEITVLATFEAFLFISDDRPINLETFYVVKNAHRSLLGRSTALRYSVLKLGFSVSVPKQVDTTEKGLILAPVVIGNPFPKFNVPPVKINYDKSRPPCRNIFTNIPQAIKPMVEKRLQDLIAADIIEPVTQDMDVSFCSSMLAVPKGKHDIRLVIDLRGPNKYIQRTPFAMPTLESILPELNGATWFSTIDMSNAFFHIELDTESRHLTNFYTEFGLFRCVRLPFGLCNAPDIFQEVLQRVILGGCSGVKNYLDDVLVFGSTKEIHDANLEEVLNRLRQHNVKLNDSKCVFSSQAVQFVGFLLTSKGWSVTDEKMRAIQSFRTPTSCTEVKSFLGLVTFADRFIQRRADLTVHLRTLANSKQFYWTELEDKEFNYLQDNALKTIKVLGYYSTTDDTELYVDASPIGLGAVLIQYDNDKVPRIIACASKSLTPTEQRYPQTQREALGVVWGVERFSSYLLGRSFVIRTDAQANEFIFSTTHRLGRRAISRAESWALRLQPYDFTVKGVRGQQNLADALSRLIHDSQTAEPFEENDTGNLLYALGDSMDITWEEIEKESEDDEELCKLHDALISDKWPKELRKYETQKKNINMIGFLIFKGDRTILPISLRRKALKAAHGGHVGESAMKKIVREFFWWPGMSVDAEKFVKNCETCAMLSRKNPPLPLSSRELPDGPWQILQVDFLSIPGCGSSEFLILVDTHSRYLTVMEMKSKDADSTNKALCEIFKMWGCPLILQSDNGPPFQSTNYIQFWENKGVKIRKSIPLSPQSNGAVERQNQGVIKAVAASKLDGTNWRHALHQYVHNHNTLVPHSRLGVTPFELLVGWKFRGNFPSLWNPKQLDYDHIREKDSEAKFISKQDADAARGSKNSSIQVGDTVLMAQQRKSKTDPTFGAEHFKVVARDGAKIVILSRSGVQYTRNVQDVKIAPAEYHLEETDDTEEIDEASHSTLDIPLAVADDKHSELDAAISSSTRHEISPNRILRNRSDVKKPMRFDDRFIYSIYD
ncbi:uncharacterized protein K02A2.6-like [Armigeres subalbatus]|uniref:uncharacterized protein K02A2.6-like n=1 Tax=Armigeres subalbatus TaxID=124917 RepID=UPI002ECFEEC2